MKWVMVMVLAIACSSEKKAKPVDLPAPVPADPSELPCIAEKLGPLHNELDFDHPCRSTTSCRPACDAGDARACGAHAYRLQEAKKGDEADRVFAQACKLGIAIACTNYAAALLMRGTTASQEACARGLFERACAVDDVMACGMIGRMMANDAKTPEEKAAARKHFEQMCEKHGGPACRMYGYHLEIGDLGEPDIIKAKALLAKACETGDPEACDRDLPSESFR